MSSLATSGPTSHGSPSEGVGAASVLTSAGWRHAELKEGTSSVRTSPSVAALLPSVPKHVSLELSSGLDTTWRHHLQKGADREGKATNSSR